MRYLVAIVIVVVLLGALAGLKATQISGLMSAGAAMQKAGPPPEAVSTAPAEQQTWEATLRAVASVVSAKGVALGNDAPGVVTRIHFESGAKVKQGQVLVELDTSVERAQLASLRARRDLAGVTVKRSQALVSAGALAQAELDSNESSLKSLSADAGALEAQIARKTIRAPFSGTLGLREVNLGQYLPPGTQVTTLEADTSSFVDFGLPQQELQRLRVGMPVRVSVEGATAPLGEGTISAIDPSVDPVTRSIQLRASLPDDANRFRPGMFVTVEVVLPEERRVVAVPVTALLRASYGDSVFVADSRALPGGKPGKVARQQFVRTGETRGDFVEVLEGLKPGQEVVTQGAFKLRNGLPLAVDNRIKLDPKLAPRPENR